MPKKKSKKKGSKKKGSKKKGSKKGKVAPAPAVIRHIPDEDIWLVHGLREYMVHKGLASGPDGGKKKGAKKGKKGSKKKSGKKKKKK
eukprot:m.28001 g.28001  ORF g.28001 m.28001 type:complete len:87 (+) comp7961_c0_seq1:99-359(+)